VGLSVILESDGSMVILLFTRMCPGIHYAKASIFIALASILATFKITLAKDDNGNDIMPVDESENQAI
jgi:hypothetical protein